MKRKVSLLAVLIVVVFFGLAIALLQLRVHKTAPVAAVLALTANQIQTESRNIDKLMQEQGIEASFKYVATKIESDPEFAKGCHPILHELGRKAYAYYGGYEQAIQHQDEMCDSGYTHGVLEAYLSSAADVSVAIKTACTSRVEQNFDQWQCYHGLGHGVMFTAQESVQKSIDVCNSFTTSFATRACINGVFMQHFVVSGHNGSVPSVNPTNLKDCHYQDRADQTDCYTYAPSAYLTVNNGQYSSAFKWCSGASPGYRATCIAGVGIQAMKDNITHADIVEQVCRSAGNTYADSCVSGAVGLYIYFYGSSSAAQPLCQNQFKQYKTACNSAITDSKNMLDI
jgi:hypothetical protein